MFSMIIANRKTAVMKSEEVRHRIDFLVKKTNNK